VEGEQQVEHRHRAVEVAPELVGEALPQAEHDHRQHEVDGELAELLAGVAQHLVEAAELVVRWLPGLAVERLDDVVGHLDQPVQRGEHRGQDAGPLVQAEDAIHAAERALEHGGAGGEHHRQRHQADGEQAAEIEALFADEPGQGGGAAVEGGDVEAPCEGEDADEGG